MHRGKYVSVCCEYRRVQDCCHLHYNTSATCMNYREKHPLELCTAVALGSSGGGGAPCWGASEAKAWPAPTGPHLVQELQQIPRIC